MSVLGERLRRLRDEKQMSQGEVGRILGVTHATVSAYETGKREPDHDTMRRLAAIFNTSVDYLLGLKNDPHPAISNAGSEEVGPPQRLPLGQDAAEREPIHLHPANIKIPTVPILGRIRAGLPLFSEQNVIGEVAAPDRLAGRADFALFVSGDSMSGVGIEDGDIVFMSTPSRLPGHGDIVAALVGNSDATLKWFMRQDGGWWLVAANPRYDPIPVTEDVKVQGIYLGLLVQRKPRELDPPIDDWSTSDLLQRLAERERLPVDALELAMQTVKMAIKGGRA